MICDSKQIKKLPAVSSKLKTIKNVIYFEDGDSTDDPKTYKDMSDWTISSFSEVEKLGKDNSAPFTKPNKTNIAVIMYTSGSTGLPKVCFRCPAKLSLGLKALNLPATHATWHHFFAVLFLNTVFFYTIGSYDDS